METFTADGTPFERWRVGASTYETCLTRGARLLRWSVGLPGATREVLHWPEGAPTALDRIGAVRGGNPVLFPFMGRNYADGEKFAWKDPDGVKRPMPQHGFARDSAFEFVEHGPKHAVVRLLPSEAGARCYPFDYEFRVRFDFLELFLRITFELENRGGAPLPWCAGHHFYFTLPWHRGLSRRDYVVRVPSKKQWRHAADGKLVPFAGLKGLTEIPFDTPELSDCIFTHLKSAAVSFGPRSGEEDVTVKVGEDPIPGSWGTVVTWTQDPEAPFYCVEPWMGPPNSPEHGNGLHFVEPGRTDTFVTEVSLM
ncbi:MAG: aldose epimerase [Opitutia bacterium]|jgi:galactose mutarotase-like enzyme